MILRERKKPLPLQKIDTLNSRLPKNHPKKKLLHTIAAQLQKGFNGERKLDYYVKSLPSHFAILNDVTLNIFGKNVQFDSLVITPQAIFVIEVKSYEGVVTFNTNHRQFIREDGEKLEGFKYPITQVENMKFHLLRWLQIHNLEGLPIYYFIVFSEVSTIFNVVGHDGVIKKVITYVDELPLRLMRFNEELANVSSPKIQLKSKIIKMILHHCKDFDIDILRKYDIKKSEIQPGVHCPECRKLGMERTHRKWYCRECGTCSNTAHEKALYDFFLLISDTINNRQCRDFLLINSRHVAKRILIDFNLKLKNGTRTWSKVNTK